MPDIDAPNAAAVATTCSPISKYTTIVSGFIPPSGISRPNKQRLHRGPCGNRRRRIGCRDRSDGSGLATAYGHGQGRDSQFSPHVLTHRPSDDQRLCARRTKTLARRLASAQALRYEQIPAAALKQNDLVLVEVGDLIPSDGEIIEGIASVDELAITGESAPVIREAGGDRSAVTGGTKVLSDWIKVRIAAAHGSTFLDRMIALVEGAERQKTPNEIALNILLAGLTLIFVISVATIPSFANYAGGKVPVVVLVALFVSLIPTTIGALLSAIGIAGMDRLVLFNVIAMSGRAVEAAGEVDTLLLDKTGTITLGNRQAAEFIPLPGVSAKELADAAQLASQTSEGRSILPNRRRPMSRARARCPAAQCYKPGGIVRPSLGLMTPAAEFARPARLPPHTMPTAMQSAVTVHLPLVRLAAWEQAAWKSGRPFGRLRRLR